MMNTSKNQPKALGRGSRWVINKLLGMTVMQVSVLLIVLGMILSVSLVIAVDLWWDGRISPELQFSGVVVSFLTGLFIVGTLVSPLLRELKQEITERKEADEAIRTSQSRFSTIFERAPLGIALVDSLTGKIYEVNPRFAEIAGRSVEEMRSIDWMSITHPDDVQRDLDNMALLNAGEIPGFNMDKRYIRPDGSIAWISMTIAPLEGARSMSPRHLCMIDNITKRKRTEDEILFKNTILKTEQETSLDAILVVDENARIISYNQQFINLWHITPEAISTGLDEPVLQSVANQIEDAEVFVARVQYLYGHRDEKSHEEIRLKDGRILDRYSSPILGNDNKYYGRVWYFRDITERKIAETKIKRLSDLYLTLSQCNKAIVYSNNKEELFTQVCRAAVESSGFKMAWIGMVNTTSKLIVPVASYGDTAGYLENIQVSINENDPHGRGPSGTALRDGEPFWCQDFQNDPRTTPWHEAGARSGWAGSAAIPIYQKGATVGAITLYAGEVNAFDESTRNLLTEMASDISYALDIFIDKAENKKMEVAMKEHALELVRLNASLQVDKREVEKDMAGDEALLQSLGEGMIATNNEGKIITMNRMAEKMLGWNENEVLGKKATDIIPAVDDKGDAIPPEKRACLMVSAKENTATLVSTMYFINKSGDRIPVTETTTPVIINGKNTGAVVIFRDITKEKEIEKTRGDLLALASHQLRTPLSGTKWLIETLQSGIKGPLLPEQKEYLTEIYKINERMTTLVVDMLGVLRMEGGTIPANKSQVSTTTVLDTLLETFTPVAKSKQLTIRVEKDGEHTIETDPLLLRNIIESFVSNAMNYSNAGGEVVISLKSESSGIVFAVKDSGIGVPKDEQKQLFERFYRASNAKMFNTRGTGLGLYIAATLAKKIGATLTFESEEGMGSTFSVHFPFSPQGPLPATHMGV